MQVVKRKLSMRPSLPTPAQRAAEAQLLNQALPFPQGSVESSHSRLSRRAVDDHGRKMGEHNTQPAVKPAAVGKATRDREGHRRGEGEEHAASQRSDASRRPWAQVSLPDTEQVLTSNCDSS